jgi:hypothetical protein
MLHTNETNRPGYGQLYIIDSAEEKIEQLENQSNQRRMAEVMQRFGELLRQVNPFIELYKRMH